MSDVVVVDYGAGNTRSVCAALSHVERESVVTSDPDAIRDAPNVILPGVGSARSAMAHLNDDRGGRRAATTISRTAARSWASVSGMQLACEHSDEGGGVEGLGLLEGDVVRLREGRVPRLGWSVVEPWGDAFYFAHSYAVRSPREVAERGWRDRGGASRIVLRRAVSPREERPGRPGVS